MGIYATAGDVVPLVTNAISIAKRATAIVTVRNHDCIMHREAITATFN